MSETDLVGDVLAAMAYEPGVWAARNNTGMLRKGRHYIRYGLGNGSADIIVIVAPVGRLVALECKVGREKQSSDQIEWERAVRSVGGYYAVVRSVADAREAVQKART